MVPRIPDIDFINVISMYLILANIRIWDVLKVAFEIKFLNSENEFFSTYLPFWRF
jgi:hypothetical protein